MRASKKNAIEPAIGIIGGSGLYHIDGMEKIREARVRTPYGAPSDALVVGAIGGVRAVFLSRHGRGHRTNPTTINYRANIYALKSMGVTHVISISAVGSMKESIHPGDVVLPDQFIDLTKHRVSTFFDEGIVAHVGFAEPVCRRLADALEEAGRSVGARLQRGGTYVCMEGPQFSTKAESRLYRQWGVEVIGMTNMPEAKLAREAELCYATVALPTDYDCWHETEEAVTVETIFATLHHNVILAKQLLKAVVPRLKPDRACGCRQALRNAIVTAPDHIAASTKRRLNLFIGPYMRKRKGSR